MLAEEPASALAVAGLRPIGFMVLLGLGTLLGGCNPQAGELAVVSAPPIEKPQARPGVSPRGATIALSSVEGPPDAIAASFAQSLTTAGARHDIAATEPKKADYLVRSYLSIYPTQQGTAVAYVLDVFDGRKRHSQRIEDAVVVAGAPTDWAVLNAPVVAQVADQASTDLAAMLTNTPEAIAAAAHPAKTAVASSAANTTVVAATPPAVAPAPAPRSVGLAAR